MKEKKTGHIKDESAIQKAGAVQRTPCIPEQIADHQKRVITCEDTSNDVLSFFFLFLFLDKSQPCSVLALIPLILLLRPL